MLLALRAHKVFKDLLELMELEQMVHKALPVLQDHKVFKDLKVHKVFKVPLELMERLVLLVLLVVPLAHKEMLVHKVLQALPVLSAQLVPLD